MDSGYTYVVQCYHTLDSDNQMSKVKVIGFFGGILNFAGLLGLWDIARHQAELQRGFYDMPFKTCVLPWYLAGDLCILIAFIGAVLLVVSDL